MPGNNKSAVVTMATSDIDFQSSGVTVATSDIKSSDVTITTSDATLGRITMATSDIKPLGVTMATSDVKSASVTMTTSEAENEMGTSSDAKNDDISKLPIDRGWAWVVLAAAFFQVFLWGGLMKSFGIFFVVYQERFRSTASETSLIATIQNVVLSVSGIFVMTIGMKHMSARTSIVIGALVNFAAYVVTAFAEDIRILYLCHGAVSGLCIAMVFLPIMSMIGVYFNKRRALANAIFSSGASLGGLTFGPVYAWLLDDYGYMGTMLIVSAFLFNILISGMLMRPMEQFTTASTDKHPDGEEGNPLIGEEMDIHDSNASSVFAASGVRDRHDSGNESIDSHEDTSHGNGIDMVDVKQAKHERTALMRTYSGPETDSDVPIDPGHRHQKRRYHMPSFNRAVSYDPAHVEDRQFPSSSLRRRLPPIVVGSLRNRTISELSHDVAMKELISSGDNMCGSLVNINIQSCMESIELHVEQDETKHHRTCFGHFMYRTFVFLKTVFDTKLLKDPVFILFLCLASANLPASVLTPVFIIPHAKDIGMTNTQAGIMLFVNGCADLVGRLTVGVIADRKWARPTTIVAMAAAIVGVTAQLLRWLHTFGTLLIFVIISGLCCGVYLALYAVILMEFLGVERFPSSLGFATMCHGASIAAFYPLIGYLRDNTGTYYFTFHLLGIVLFLAAALSLTLPHVANWRRRKRCRADT